jgi:ATP-binding cassette subfamily B protein
MICKANCKGDARPSGAVGLLATRLRGRKLAWLVFASAMMLVGAFAANLPAWLSGLIVDQVVDGDLQSLNKALPYLLVLTASYVMREIAAIARKYAVERTACDLERDELQRLCGFLLHIDLSAFWGQRIGGLNVRIHRSLEGLIKLIKLLFLDLLPTLVLAGVALLMASQKSAPVVMLMAAVFTLALVLTLAQILTQKGIRLSLFKAKEEVSANLTEVLMGLDYVRASGGMAQEEKRTAALADQLRNQEFRHHKWMMGFDGAKQILEGLALVAVLMVAAWQVGQGVISKGDVLTLVLLYASVAAPLRELHRIIDESFEGYLKVRELAGLYRMDADKGLPGGSALPLEKSPEAVVSVASLRFALGDAEGAPVDLIGNLDLRIDSGEWLGIAGRSGCGKSTLLKILLGLSPNYVGSAKVFGVEVRDVVKTDLWNRVGYVGQTAYIIKGTVRSNLTYGTALSVTDEQLIAALDLAGLRDRFRVNEVDRLDLDIEEQGRNLSGGEKQRLAIARLFLRQPSLIVLDEATSALDYENEWQLIENLRRRFSGVSAIVVAHRLEALKRTDRIIVMKSGVIVEEGSFSLLSQGGGEFMKVANLARAA